MSFWFYGRKRSGRRSIYSVNIPIVAILTLLAAVILGLLLPLMRILR
jgi:hypothetical protein